MFGKLFKSDYNYEDMIYKYISEYITNLKTLLDSWINNNKYRNNPEFYSLFSLLLDIELEINALKNKNDSKLKNKLSEAYKRLDLCLNKIKNKILSLCEESYDNADLLEISSELIKLRNMVARNINITALKRVATETKSTNYLESGTSTIYDNILRLENQIYIRKNEMQTSEIKYR